MVVSPPMCFQPSHGIVQPGLLSSRVKTVRLNLGKPFQLIALSCSAKLGTCEFDVSQRVDSPPSDEEVTRYIMRLLVCYSWSRDGHGPRT